MKTGGYELESVPRSHEVIGLMVEYSKVFRNAQRLKAYPRWKPYTIEGYLGAHRP
jgi:hypothetical protein